MLAARNEVVFPAVLHDRARDAWEALLAMGHTVDYDWAGPAGRALRACQYVAGDADDDLEAHEQLLVDLRAVFRAAGDPETLSTNHLLSALQALEERPWSEWRRRKPISARGLAHVLRPFKVQPETIRFTAGLAKGYRRDALQPAWTRYLPQDRGVLPVTSVTSLNREDLSAVRSVTTDSAVTDRSGDKPSRINDVTDVTPDEGAQYHGSMGGTSGDPGIRRWLLPRTRRGPGHQAHHLIPTVRSFRWSGTTWPRSPLR